MNNELRDNIADFLDSYVSNNGIRWFYEAKGDGDLADTLASEFEDAGWTHEQWQEFVLTLDAGQTTSVYVGGFWYEDGEIV